MKVLWDINMNPPFEFDWISLLLGNRPIEFVDADYQPVPNAEPVVLICQAMDDYGPIVDRLIAAKLPFGIILLSDEHLTEKMPWLSHDLCRFLIRNYYNPRLAAHDKVYHFGLGYKTGFIPSDRNILDRQYKWSFTGHPHNVSRRTALQYFKSIPGGYVLTTETFNSPNGLDVDSYAKLIADSQFVLCPPGHSSNDSFRLYESLEGGAIPVVVTSDIIYHYYPSYWYYIFGHQDLPFVVAHNWRQCKRIVVELSRDNHRLHERQRQCRTFWLDNKQRWSNDIQAILSQLEAGTPVTIPRTSGRVWTLRRRMHGKWTSAKRRTKSYIKRLLGRSS